jgi:hypothetical protein
MKAVEATETIGRMLEKIVEGNRHTGDITVSMNCNQGGIRSIKIDVVETRISSFEFGSKKKDVDN